MNPPVSDIAFTPSVKAVQVRLGSREGYASMEQRGGWSDTITPELGAFIAERDTFFIATANAAGQPYIQHRGGPQGFLKVLDERTLGFADFSGNRQYITVGNLNDNPKAFIFLMDFCEPTPHQDLGPGRGCRRRQRAVREPLRPRVRERAGAHVLVPRRRMGRELSATHQTSIHREGDWRLGRCPSFAHHGTGGSGTRLLTRRRKRHVGHLQRSLQLCGGPSAAGATREGGMPRRYGSLSRLAVAGLGWTGG